MASSDLMSAFACRADLGALRPSDVPQLQFAAPAVFAFEPCFGCTTAFLLRQPPHRRPLPASSTECQWLIGCQDAAYLRERRRGRLYPWQRYDLRRHGCRVRLGNLRRIFRDWLLPDNLEQIPVDFNWSFRHFIFPSGRIGRQFFTSYITYMYIIFFIHFFLVCV